MPGCIAKGSEIRITKNYLHSHIHHNFIHNSQDLEKKKPSMSCGGGIDKENVV